MEASVGRKHIYPKMVKVLDIEGGRDRRVVDALV